MGHLNDGLITSTDNVRLGGHPNDGLVTSTDNFRLVGVSGCTPKLGGKWEHPKVGG